ncbi:ornithine carbamoyltransferase [Listeria ivanovii]|uniref:Ornithine carbamoyltransferase n=1 Tax=Listeria ivanovii (strain ATCC BAA-678 / PAM 55) TaxID=881621 RepID=G2Z9S9_LISIP|nr:ornithine carbamoyltransferase [Listeria ivanovii]AHI56084.1 ornithine carbamoyltransferase [Listeria ivanovii WSLC3009]AIS65520.1 ornithine carbamoyltransferase [Listeria ivanovii subsp. ivanovii]MBC1759436.1 ornithine carbamoyltransferase [Listeria ivanovii]MBK3914314.1 ornithine carbamoyltransferase [Listeria ivanovii subsp. ivanovii]MBK3921787.1 ornithine carbamoyltransferase [Listeria ivanovii subsp. ivanovii]
MKVDTKTNTLGKDMLSLLEWNKAELIAMMELAVSMKTNPAHYSHILSGKILGMIFDKPSTRTRVSFEAGILQLGGQAIVMSSKELQIGRGEPIKDTAHVMSEYIDAIMIRTFSHQKVEELALHAEIPIINGLTDLHHPCQALADLMTIYEWKDQFNGVKLAYIGDGNNVCHSLLLAGAMVGLDMSLAMPKGYEVDEEILLTAQKLAAETGGGISITEDPKLAVMDADFIYTDVWTSMGQEEENAKRLADFGEKYQVNADLAKYAKSDYHFLHCLPAHREEEVTAEIIDGEHSVIYQQAGNRLHAQKALLVAILEAK